MIACLLLVSAQLRCVLFVSFRFKMFGVVLL